VSKSPENQVLEDFPPKGFSINKCAVALVA
jgi:hypothetical protein